MRIADTVQINGVLGEVYPDNQNRAADVTCIVFVFIYAVGYSLGFGPAAWVYGAEVRWADPFLPYGTPDLTGADIPYFGTSQGTEFLGIWRSDRINCRGTGLAGGH